MTKKYGESISFGIIANVSFIFSISNSSNSFFVFVVSSSFSSFILFILSISSFSITFSCLFITVFRFFISFGFSISYGFGIFVYAKIFFFDFEILLAESIYHYWKSCYQGFVREKDGNRSKIIDCNLVIFCYKEFEKFALCKPISQSEVIFIAFLSQSKADM